MFAPETRDTVNVLEKMGTKVSVHEEKGWVHAWPVVKLFLCNEGNERMSGLRSIVSVTKERVPAKKIE